MQERNEQQVIDIPNVNSVNDNLWQPHKFQQITKRRMKNQQKENPKHLTYDTKPKSKYRPEIWTSIDAEKLMKSATNLPNSIEIKITNPKPAMQK